MQCSMLSCVNIWKCDSVSKRRHTLHKCRHVSTTDAEAQVKYGIRLPKLKRGMRPELKHGTAQLHPFGPCLPQQCLEPWPKHGPNGRQETFALVWVSMWMRVHVYKVFAQTCPDKRLQILHSSFFPAPLFLNLRRSNRRSLHLVSHGLPQLTSSPESRKSCTSFRHMCRYIDV